jgi:hypothetical protein
MINVLNNEKYPSKEDILKSLPDKIVIKTKHPINKVKVLKYEIEKEGDTPLNSNEFETIGTFEGELEITDDMKSAILILNESFNNGPYISFPENGERTFSIKFNEKITDDFEISQEDLDKLILQRSAWGAYTWIYYYKDMISRMNSYNFDLTKKVKKNSKRFQLLWLFVNVSTSFKRSELVSKLGKPGITDLLWSFVGDKRNDGFYKAPLILRTGNGWYELTDYGKLVYDNSNK